MALERAPRPELRGHIHRSRRPITRRHQPAVCARVGGVRGARHDRRKASVPSLERGGVGARRRWIHGWIQSAHANRQVSEVLEAGRGAIERLRHVARARPV